MHRKIKIYYGENQLVPRSELVILFGKLDCKYYAGNPLLTFNYQDRFRNTKELCNNLWSYTKSQSDADIFVYPKKFIDLEDKHLLHFTESAGRLGKKVLAFTIDDNGEQFALPDNLFLFRTSLDSRVKTAREYAMPAFTADYYNSNLFLLNNNSIGYCGHTNHGRLKALDALKVANLNYDFIIRDGFWAPEIVDKERAKEDFINNIKRNLMTFCMRGAGNFSYRFYETLMMARIPFLLDTHCVLPFFDEVKSKLTMIQITIEELQRPKVVDSLLDRLSVLSQSDLLFSQLENRMIWQNFFSPCGFLKNVDKLIRSLI